ncbi:hypothetical protein FHX34_1011283 [Actinoplanes teichomyceticus]|uniref:Uncharacterized protein n=2 Tax=Actinoplanes teichomyceticus TaxID=1867 RepID=A0A561WR04_ACTTI|nr:hypothetical protein FHX34_1011283 [Actinoplanes teichomyceticus]
MRRGEVARAWPMIRRSCLDPVAKANGVGVSRQQSHGTWGTSTYTSFDPEGVSRLAPRLASGEAVVRPEWRRDSREGRRAMLVTVRDTVIVIGFVVLCVAGWLWFAVTR